MWPSLAQRSTEPELLDLGVDRSEALASLDDLRFVNRWLGARGSFLRAVLPLLEGTSRPSLLDVGCGSGDVAAFLRGAAHRDVRTVGLDIKALHLSRLSADVRGVVADVRRLPFPPRSFDVVTASLFLHHFDAPDLPVILRDLVGLARRGLVVNDLRRARVPWLFGKLAFPWLFRAQVSVHDGLVSIRRGFTEGELLEAFAAADIRDVTLRRRFPYRLLVVARP